MYFSYHNVIKNKIKIRYNRILKSYDVLLINNSVKDQQKFSQALSEFFTYSPSSRYIILKNIGSIPVYRYSFAIPKELAKNKHSARVFTLFLIFIKKFNLIYLKNNQHIAYKCSAYNYLNFGCRPITKRQNDI